MLNKNDRHEEFYRGLRQGLGSPHTPETAPPSSARPPGLDPGRSTSAPLLSSSLEPVSQPLCLLHAQQRRALGEQDFMTDPGLLPVCVALDKLILFSWGANPDSLLGAIVRAAGDVAAWKALT